MSFLQFELISLQVLLGLNTPSAHTFFGRLRQHWVRLVTLRVFWCELVGGVSFSYGNSMVCSNAIFKWPLFPLHWNAYFKMCMCISAYFLACHFSLWMQGVAMGTMTSVTPRDLIILSEKKKTLYFECSLPSPAVNNLIECSKRVDSSYNAVSLHIWLKSLCKTWICIWKFVLARGMQFFLCHLLSWDFI